MKIDIELIGHYSNNGPMCQIEINDCVLHDDVLEQGHNTFSFDINPLEINYLRIHHYGKKNEDTLVDQNGQIVKDKAVELKKISIESVYILKNVLYNKPYYVNWPDNLSQDFINRGEAVPEYITNTLFFGFNGYYEFDFVGDFLRQYYRQFWEDETQAHINQTKLIELDGEQIEAFERYGKDTAINQNFDLTIHDLAQLIEDDSNNDSNEQ